MKNKAKKKSERRKVSIGFHQRLVKYGGLLAEIEKDYSNNRLIPALRDTPESAVDEMGLFSWARKERLNKYVGKMQRRTKVIQALRAELHHVLEISSEENHENGGTKFSTVIFDEPV